MIFRNRALISAFSFFCTIFCAGTQATPLRTEQAPTQTPSTGNTPADFLVPFAPPLITDTINNNQLSPMGTNVPPEVAVAIDQGRVDDSLVLDHMLLLLHRPDAQEQALEQVMTEQTTLGSPNYHEWLSAAQFGQYGLAPSDLNTITSWLELQGFTVNQLHTNGVMIDFSGTAGQVRQTFKTEIHNLSVNGVKHIANMSVPLMPSALVPAVIGIVSINDFRPHTNFELKPDYTYTYMGEPIYALVPADLATIYNLNPLFNAQINGAGQTIALIEDGDPYNSTSSTVNPDINTFRLTFGLPAFGPSPAPSYEEVHPSCIDPGDLNNGDDFEVETDVEYSGAAAPGGSSLEMISCGDTQTTFGGLIAMQNLLETTDAARLWSISYGACEALNGAAQNVAYATTYQQAAAAGISVFVSSGDEGAASCDAFDNANGAPPTVATLGIGVNGFASTPYNVAVGGTDFGDTYAGTNSTYWNAANANSVYYGSAKSYIDEIPWNNSCASELLSTFKGYGLPYGPKGFCNSSIATTPVNGQDYLTLASGGGGPSGCATGAASTEGVVSGTCAGTPKPAWQQGLFGNPADGVRDLPDVSLFAANGVWGHYWVICYSNPGAGTGGAPCTGAPSGWAGGGGTSFSSPIMAGIQALVNQKTNANQGNPNSTYYGLAKTEYGSHGNTNCDSSNVLTNTCIFYDITQGDMDVNCTGTNNCYLDSGKNGVLSTSNTAYLPAFPATNGWRFCYRHR